MPRLQPIVGRGLGAAASSVSSRPIVDPQYIHASARPLRSPAVVDRGGRAYPTATVGGWNGRARCRDRDRGEPLDPPQTAAEPPAASAGGR